jgi:hypothetical protein
MPPRPQRPKQSQRPSRPKRPSERRDNPKLPGAHEGAPKPVDPNSPTETVNGKTPAAREAEEGSPE